MAVGPFVCLTGASPVSQGRWHLDKLFGPDSSCHPNLSSKRGRESLGWRCALFPMDMGRAGSAASTCCCCCVCAPVHGCRCFRTCLRLLACGCSGNTRRGEAWRGEAGRAFLCGRISPSLGDRRGQPGVRCSRCDRSEILLCLSAAQGTLYPHLVMSWSGRSGCARRKK